MALRQWRPDLEVAVADWGPTGLGVVRGLDRRSTVLTDHYDDIVEHLLAMPYRELDDGTMDERLHRVPGTWEALRGLLPDHPYRSGNVDLLTARRAAHEVVPAARRSIEFRRAARRRTGGAPPPVRTWPEGPGRQLAGVGPLPESVVSNRR